MAIYRNVQLSFWTDNKVEDDFTPEDKYFYIYLLTNPQTNICGCYEVSYSQMTRQTGYNKDTIIRLLERFDKVHKSEKVLAGVLGVAKHIKSDEFRKYVNDMVDSIKNDTLYIGYTYPMETSVSDTVSDTVSDSVSVNNNIVNKRKDNIDNNIYINIISYLNNRCNTRYRYNTPNTKKHIGARIKEGYTEQDFYTVIDKKVNEWLGTERERYLRPDTLFGTKFESYLNQNVVSEKQGNQNFNKGAIDWDNV